MEKVTAEQLNEAAMKIIMLAGDGRNLMTEAMKDTLDGCDIDDVDKKMTGANDKIADAHHIQTEMIQYTIEEDDLQTTLLFSHAQDTLMTVYSESKMIAHMINMYRKLSEKIDNLN